MLEDGDVIISVKDNGMGMSESRLKQIIANLDDKNHVISGHKIRESYGLYNVNQRIKLKLGSIWAVNHKCI